MHSNVRSCTKFAPYSYNLSHDFFTSNLARYVDQRINPSIARVTIYFIYSFADKYTKIFANQFHEHDTRGVSIEPTEGAEEPYLRGNVSMSEE